MNGKHLAALGMLLPLVGCQNRAERPNIVFFLVDDYGWLDSQVAYGEQPYPRNLMIDTPNMCCLAQMGVVMTNAYACSLSTPTRTSLMTGMNSAHERITSYTSPYRDTPTDASGGTIGIRNDNEQDIFSRPEWNWNGISPVPGIANTLHVSPMVQFLKDAGYYTVHCGKAHWGCMGTPGASPLNLGFTVNISGNITGMPRSYQSEDNFGNSAELWNHSAVQNMSEYYGTGTHLTQALTLEALKTLDYPISHKEPFYLYLAHYAVHTPIQADSRYYQKYVDRGLDEGQARYASMVEGVDTSLGMLMDYLEQRGVADNTIIIFYSDNGGHSIDTRKGGVAHHVNDPLREGKGSVYEGGIRVPMMFYWPGKTYAGARINTPVVPEDMFRTILHMAGVSGYDTIQPLDGLDLCGLITDGSQYVGKAMARGEISNQVEANSFVIPQSVSGVNPQRDVISHMPHQWRIEDQYDVDYMSSIRRGEYKLVYRMETSQLELYNLKEDISERNDISKQNPQLVEQLARALSDRLREWNAAMPVVKQTGEPVKMPDELL